MPILTRTTLRVELRIMISESELEKNIARHTREAHDYRELIGSSRYLTNAEVYVIH